MAPGVGVAAGVANPHVETEVSQDVRKRLKDSVFRLGTVETDEQKDLETLALNSYSTAALNPILN